MDSIAAKLSEKGLVVFLYHGIINKQTHPVRNYTKKHLLADVFYGQMKALSKCGLPLSMNEVLNHIETRTPFPARAFAITFDDGFENNLSVAAPILSDLNIPAMLYLTTSFIDSNAMSWIDKIEFAVQYAKNQKIRLFWDREKLFDVSDVSSRIDLLNKIRLFVKSQKNCDPYEFARKLCEILNIVEPQTSDDPIDKKLTWAQVQDIQKSKFLSIGGHGHTHSILSFLSEEKLDFEITSSINMFKEKIGFSPIHYSYPEGLNHCFSQLVIDKLKGVGVRCSPTAEPGVNTCDIDPFYIKRVMV